MTEVIHQVADVEALRTALRNQSHWSRCALAMKPLSGGRFTFEFWLMQGSLDPALVSRWASICYALVKIAKVLPDEYGSSRTVQMAYWRIHLVGQQVETGGMALLKLLKWSKDIEFWKKKMASYAIPGGWLQDEQDVDGFVTRLQK